ncbi:24027_t:CDS:2 [Entrophospora sp. SA101]|nr:24027_t:CDS:2 [Entrophospora sp. SA101]
MGCNTGSCSGKNEDEIKDKDSQEMTDKLLRITFLQIIKEYSLENWNLIMIMVTVILMLMSSSKPQNRISQTSLEKILKLIET